MTKASSTVTGYSVTYDGSSHTATGSCTGVHGETLNGLDLSGTTHTDAGPYTHSWTFTDVTGNYNNASGSVSDNIDKANPSCLVAGYTVTYDGNPHTSTGSCTGVLSETLSGLDLSGTTHTNAGTFLADPWSFTDVTGNYNNDSGTVNNSILKADQTITFAQPSSPVPFMATFHINPTATSSLTIEGKLKDIRVEGNQRFRSGYISDRLSLSAGPPVNIYQLQESLLRLQQDQRISADQRRAQPRHPARREQPEGIG